MNFLFCFVLVVGFFEKKKLTIAMKYCVAFCCQKLERLNKKEMKHLKI